GGIAFGDADGTGDLAGNLLDEGRSATATDACGARVGVGGEDHHVRWREAGAFGDELLRAFGQERTDTDEVADDEREVGFAIVEVEGAGVEGIVDAEGDVGAAAVAIERGADRRGDIDGGGADSHVGTLPESR